MFKYRKNKCILSRPRDCIQETCPFHPYLPIWLQGHHQNCLCLRKLKPSSTPFSLHTIWPQTNPTTSQRVFERVRVSLRKCVCELRRRERERERVRRGVGLAHLCYKGENTWFLKWQFYAGKRAFYEMTKKIVSRRRTRNDPLRVKPAAQGPSERLQRASKLGSTPACLSDQFCSSCAARQVERQQL